MNLDVFVQNFMNFLTKIFNGKNNNTTLDKDQIAKLLSTNREALEAFENSYHIKVLNDKEDDLFHINSRQASAEVRTVSTDAVPTEDIYKQIEPIKTQIVNDLVAQTYVYSFDGNLQQTVKALTFKTASDITETINEAVKLIPLAFRPQLTGDSSVKQMNGFSSVALLFNSQKMMDKNLSSATRKTFYNMFRQGLDILDLDPILYEMLGMNKNSMGHWLPQLVTACMGQDFFRIPATKIAKVPITLLQMTCIDYQMLTPTTLNIIDEWAMKVFELDENKDYFIKTGTYSSKFDFRNAHVKGAKEVRELGEYLTFIQFQAQNMAGPLATPSIYGVSTTNEWVVREFIGDKENNPCIYKGLPLHTEYRVFIDCDKNEIIGFNPYWDPEIMLKRFGHEADADSPHQIHDYIIYKSYEETLMKRYNDNIQTVLEHIKELLPKLALQGQWSVDVMQNGDDFLIIDMATAETSAFYDKVPMKLRRPQPEWWLPKLDNKPVWLLN